MKKILFFAAMIALLSLSACGGKAEDLQVQVDDLTAQVDSLTVEAEGLQSELTLAESTVGLCVISLEEEVTATSGLRGTLSDALDGLAASEEDFEACIEEVISLSLGSEMGGGGEDEVVEDECAGTERTVMISTPVLQQALNKRGNPKYNANDKMVMITIDNSWIEGFTVGDVVCVTKNYGVAGGWSVYLISGTRTADYNLFIPAHYLEPLPGKAPPFTSAPNNCHPSYPNFCIPSPPPDLDCGDIPYENWNFTVYPPDPHGFDANDNGIGCEG